jgi:hypothetical protein
MAIEATDGIEAGEIALKGLDFNEAPRIGILGDSGVGKTEAMRRLIAQYRKKRPKAPILICDDKEATAQFKGHERKDIYDLRDRPVHSGEPTIVLRGDRFDRKRGRVDPETIAEAQWHLAQANQESLGVYDELANACVYGQWKAGGNSAISWNFTKGRNVGAASFWGTQETQFVPPEPFNQSSNIFAFRMMGNPVRLLKQRGYLEGGVEKVIIGLPGDELPRGQRGYFVLLQRGRPWNGKVYRYR